MTKKLVLIDSNALVHRAFHALPPSMASPKGVMTNAVYGFASVLLKMLKELEPDYVAATFDMAEPTFRHEEFAEYKATRTRAPDELYAQIPLVKELLAAFGIPVFELAGFEADDIIGTLAEQAKQVKGLQTIIVTGDMDTLQLVDGRKVVVFTLRKGVTDTVTYDESAVRERYGLTPAQVVDFKGLKGDPSDNIPGVSGIGEKTATALIQELGGISKIYAALERGAAGSVSQKLAEKLIAGKESALFSQKLATINRNAPIILTLVEADWRAQYDGAALESLMRELGFSSLIKRLPTALQGVVRTTTSVAPEQHSIPVHTDVPLDDLPLNQEVAIALDDHNLAVAAGDRNLYLAAIPRSPSAPLDRAPLVIGHGLKSMLKRVRIAAPLFDVRIAAWLLNPDVHAYDLEILAQQYLARAIPEDLALRAQVALELKYVLEKELERSALTGVFRDIEMPLVPVLAAMEERGIAVNASAIKKLGVTTRTAITKLEKRIYRAAGGPFNINSPAQLADVLFSKLGIAGKVKKTGTGAPSTAAAELEKLRDQHPIIADILEYRELQKLQTTYIEPFPALVGSDKRIHTTYNQTGTGTGRLSSQDPNLQNIPTRTELGQAFRRAFVAPRGRVLASFDYSQVELRVVAHLAHDETMLATFQRGEDIHTRTAAEIFHVAPDEVTKDMRRTAKVLNFGIIYGMGSLGFARAAGVDRTRAKEFIDEYFSEFTGVAAYMERMRDAAYRDGHVETLFGRRRLLPDARSSMPQLRAQAERMAINHPVQGTAADLMKLAMLRVATLLHERGLEDEVLMLLQVHDELVFELPKGRVDILAEIRHAMESVATLDVPLVVDVRTGPTWADTESVDL